MEKYFIIYDSNIEVFKTKEDVMDRIAELVDEEGYSISRHDFSKDEELVANDNIVVIYGKQSIIKNIYKMEEDMK